MVAVTVFLIGWTIPSALGQTSLSGRNDVICNFPSEYVFTRNNSCVTCPGQCATCLPEVVDVRYPCTSCSDTHGMLQNPSDSDPGFTLESGFLLRGGTCLPCNTVRRFSSYGSRKVRLSAVSGSNLEGRLEVYYKGKWHTVCDDNWNLVNTDVVCRELGLGRGERFYHVYDHANPSLLTLELSFDDVICHGDEASFFHCTLSKYQQHNCQPFETVGIKCSGPATERYCVNADGCPFGQYPNDTTWRCDDCARECFNCYSAPQKCTSCEEFRFLWNEQSCVEKCPDGSYGNSVTGKCERCNETCATCADGVTGSRCLTCHESYFRYGTSCVTGCPAGTSEFNSSTAEAVCMETCPFGFYSNSGECAPCDYNCLDCITDVSNCTACQEGKVLQPVGQPFNTTRAICHTWCSGGYHANSASVCQLCESEGCLDCFEDISVCKQCARGFRLYQTTCVTRCPGDLFATDSACVPQCPDGYYGDVATMSCRACVGNCMSCLEHDPGYCLTCRPGFYLRGSACVEDCGPGYAPEGSHASVYVRLRGAESSLDGRVEVLPEGTT